MGLLDNKRALIVGLASDRSIAYGIAEAMHREGCTLAFAYQGEKLKERVTKMAKNDFNSDLVFSCDVSSDAQIENLFKELNKHWDSLDILVHSVAYAPKDQLENDYLESVNREGFKIAHDISSYSLAGLAKAAFPLMENRPEGGAILTLSYLGAEKALQNYNVMGLAKASLEANVRYLANSLGPKKIRVNAISAGPIRTLAASGIAGFRKILAYNEAVTPLRQNTTTEQVGNTAAFLCSNLASGITGEIIHVDGGFHAIVSMTENTST
ncbi:MAG: enoyl-ACP reductase [Rickettsiella sp.]|nr:enoyl-ACP reductase [Rickettsiella sp.]